MPASLPPFGIEIVAPPPDASELVTPVAEPQQPQKIEYSPEQQAHLDKVIKEAMARTAKEVRAENARLQRDLEAARRVSPPPAEDASIALAEARAELQALRSEKQEAAVREALRRAVGTTFIDGELACSILRQNIKIGADGKPVVVDADGGERLGKDFNAMSLGDFAAELAAAKPFLARSDAKGGAGSTPSQGMPGSEPRLENLFGKNSNGPAANQLSLRDPLKYRRLRQLAREKGLI